MSRADVRYSRYQKLAGTTNLGQQSLFCFFSHLVNTGPTPDGRRLFHPGSLDDDNRSLRSQGMLSCPPPLWRSASGRKTASGRPHGEMKTTTKTTMHIARKWWPGCRLTRSRNSTLLKVTGEVSKQIVVHPAAFTHANPFQDKKIIDSRQFF